MLQTPVRFKTDQNVSWEEVYENVTINAARDLPTVGLKRICICGGGPSLSDNLADIKRHQAAGFSVASMNGSHDYLISHGIVPTYHFLLDARSLNVQFVENSHPDVTYVIASQAHPDAIDELLSKARKVHLWHVDNYKHVGELLHKMAPKADKYGGDICVGLSCLNVIFTMGYRSWHFYGYDASNRGADQHHAYPQALNDDQPTFEFTFQGQKFYAPGPMANKAKRFLVRWKKFRDLGIDFHLYGDGLLPTIFRARKDFLENATLDEVERDKYKRMWEYDAYRDDSPGENLLEIFLNEFDSHKGDKVIDFGCGTGRATKALMDQGYRVLGVDFVANCLDDNITIPFCLANLWDLPEGISGDWGYCCDVMEHIPEARVDDVLANIARSVKRGAFFNICFVGDTFGVAVGEVLHETVRPPEWWEQKLKRYFGKVRLIGSTSEEKVDGAFVCTEPL